MQFNNIQMGTPVSAEVKYCFGKKSRRVSGILWARRVKGRGCDPVPFVVYKVPVGYDEQVATDSSQFNMVIVKEKSIRRNWLLIFLIYFGFTDWQGENEYYDHINKYFKKYPERSPYAEREVEQNDF